MKIECNKKLIFLMKEKTIKIISKNLNTVKAAKFCALKSLALANDIA